jgi:hypothetical protein
MLDLLHLLVVEAARAALRIFQNDGCFYHRNVCKCSEINSAEVVTLARPLEATPDSIG